MARVTLTQSRRKRRYYGVVLFVFLLAAAGVGLYRFPPSLLDMNRIFRLAADKINRASADIASAEPVLRGTVYDQNYNELAVSYLLYSVYVRPGEIKNREEVIRALTEATGLEPDSIGSLLAQEKNQIKIGDSLEREDVAALRQDMLPGVYVKPMEERFYPAHESSAMLVGYMSDGMGLAGVEGAFDMLLQHGEFQAASFPEIDFQGRQVLGRDTVDIVLTIDPVLQQVMESHLQAYLDQDGSSGGQAVLLDARTGAILAWAGLPSFNPNYYWQAPAKTTGPISGNIAPGLYRNLQIRASAIRKNGEAGPTLLPETIAAPDYGLRDSETQWFVELAGPDIYRDFFDGRGDGQVRDTGEQKDTSTLDILQLARISAVLVNGGRQIRPHILVSVYDHELQRQFERSGSPEGDGHQRIVSPAMGIRLKRELLTPSKAGPDNLLYHVASSVRMIKADRKNRFVMQKLLLGAIPAQSPSLVLAVVTQRDALYPGATKSRSGADERLAGLAQKVLPLLLHREDKQMLASMPREKKSSNYNQFLISRRMEFREQNAERVAMDMVMPKLAGLSLRKGLQRLNDYPLMVRIEGSGHIVSQSPSPGEKLHGVGECILKLDSKI